MRNFWVLLFLLLACISPSYADSESDGAAAEQAGKLREALTDNVAALQIVLEGGIVDQHLRERIIALAQKLTPPPAVPEEAIRYEGRAEAALKSAKTKDDFLDAAKEYNRALLIAPWVSSYYFNLGIVLEKAENYAGAIRNFRFYLLAAPNASDTVDVKKKIAGLEYEMEKTAKAKVAEDDQRLADERLAAKLVGTWAHPPLKITNPQGQRVTLVRERIQIRVEGTKVTATYIGLPATDANLTRSWYNSVRLPFIDAKIHRGRLVGTWNMIWSSSDGAGISKTEPLDMKIEMSSDEKWFKLGDFAWETWEENWSMFYRKE